MRPNTPVLVVLALAALVVITASAWWNDRQRARRAARRELARLKRQHETPPPPGLSLSLGIHMSEAAAAMRRLGDAFAAIGGGARDWSDDDDR